MQPFDPSRPVLDAADGLEDWTEQELQEVSNSLQTVHDLDVRGQPPDKVETGMMRYADGVGWDPGQGPGPYYFDGTFWQPMFNVPDRGQVDEGGVTMNRTTPWASPGTISGTPWVMNNYETVIGYPVDCSYDLAAGHIIFDEPGMWLLGFQISLQVASSSANTTRGAAVEVYDMDTGSREHIGTNAVARYGETLGIGGVLRVGIADARIGDRYVLRIYSPTGDTIVVNSVQFATYWAARVSNIETHPD